MKLRIEKTIDFWMSPDSQTWTYSTVKGVSDPVTKFKIILTIIEVITTKKVPKLNMNSLENTSWIESFEEGGLSLGLPARML